MILESCEVCSAGVENQSLAAVLLEEIFERFRKSGRLLVHTEGKPW